MTSQIGQLAIRNLANPAEKPLDLERLSYYYESNTSPLNTPRSDEVLRTAVEDRNILVAEYEIGTEQRIVAASAVFQHFDGKYLEVGATRVTANGFSLQGLLYSVAITQQAIFEAMACRTIYCTVLPSNSASVYNIEKAGFELWPQPPEELLKKKIDDAAKAGRSAEVTFFRLPESALAGAAVNLSLIHI